MSDKKAICVPGGKGVILPLLEIEQEWPRALRVVLYMIFLFWCFMGVAIIADIFMASIEKVTSKKISRWNAAKGRWYTFELWNPTVANLTLMALGSSAPEILLNVIDIIVNEFRLEGLGPSTIVGSAAFNMLMILAVCVVAIPNDEVRVIKETRVFAVTAVWSIFAYIWLLVILSWNSPNVVEVSEGVTTFAFFPVLCFLAWLADKGYCGGADQNEGHIALEDMTQAELAQMEAKVRAEHGENMTPSQIARVLKAQDIKRSSRAVRRVGATRAMFGGKRVKVPEMRKSLSNRFSKKVVPVEGTQSQPVCIFECENERCAVLESVGDVQVKVLRTGDVSSTGKIRYCTVDGSALKEKDYTHTEGMLIFEPGEKERVISVSIIDNQKCEPDKDFSVVLSEPDVEDGKLGELGPKSETVVTIIDDDDAGVLAFSSDQMSVIQKAEDYDVDVVVLRRHGLNGEVTVEYNTEEDTAKAGRDFVMTKGILNFADKQDEAVLSITIKAAVDYETTDRFRVLLSNATGGATFDADTDGGNRRNILTVTIEAEDEQKDRVQKIMGEVSVVWDKSKIGHKNWAQQFKDAITVNGAADDDDDEPTEPPTCQDKVMHCIALPWKLLFAIVPPTDYCGGWLCFVCALIMTGVVTVIIGDTASLLGCCMCIPTDITAITFVALGTSLPDTFASKTAAVDDPTADAAVGNVTGSNSVNVFLGLGLPWGMAAIYWATKEDTTEWDALYQTAPGLGWLGPPEHRKMAFVVQAGSLAFSVAVFSTCAVLCLITLQIRRCFCGGELGGGTVSKYVSGAFLTLLWLLYIILSAWYSLSENPAKCEA